MSRWTVYKAGRYAWTAHREGDLPHELFPTWRMAMDYADRMARTREYVLPRLTPFAVGALSQKRLMHYDPEHAETLALAMLAYKELALAEQEESCEK